MTDHQNTVRDLANAVGVVNHRSYNTFGVLTEETANAVDCVFGYTGKMFDDMTTLQNNVNRWYNPTLGKWLSEDPIGFNGMDVNLYHYVGNDAVNKLDPTGEIPPLVVLCFIPLIPLLGGCNDTNISPGHRQEYNLDTVSGVHSLVGYLSQPGVWTPGMTIVGAGAQMMSGCTALETANLLILRKMRELGAYDLNTEPWKSKYEELEKLQQNISEIMNKHCRL